MDTATIGQHVTPQDLLEMPDAAGYELVDGRLVERTMSSESSYVAGNAFFLLKTHVRQTDSGWVFPADAGYQCFPDAPAKVRKPDTSFVRKDRLPNGPGAGFLKVVPNLVVEVLSPHDLALDVEQKIVEYQTAGVQLIWVVNPEARRVRVHRQDGSISGLSVEDDLDGEGVLPGFRCRVGELFEGLPLERESPRAADAEEPTSHETR